MVYVLVPAHNSKEEVLSLLACLGRQTYPDLKVILVDDGSTDGTETEVARRFQLTTILKGDGDLWWTGANALGIKHIRTIAGPDDFVLLLNNDVVVDENYVSVLVDCSSRNQRAVVGSVTVDAHDPSKVAAGIRLDCKLNATVTRDRKVIEASHGQEDSDVLPGRGTLVPIEVFEKAGTFNHRRLPHYGGDYEFTIRAKRAGTRLIVSYGAKVHARLDISGLSIPDRERILVSECIALLTSRRSAANPYYYLTYVWMCSETGWKLKNTLSHGLGLFLDTVGKTAIGYPFAAMFRWTTKGLRVARRPCDS
jgi:GT2 family glycosyltransferase